MAELLGVAQVRASLRARGSEPKLLRRRQVEGGGGGEGEEGGGEEEFQRVTHAIQLRLSESFRDASTIFALVSEGEQILTLGLEWSAEKGLPSDW